MRDEEELLDEARRSREETERLREESALERDAEPEPEVPESTRTDAPSDEPSNGDTAK